MYFPILIDWTSPFPILGLLGSIFHFYQNFKRNSAFNIGEPDQTPRFATSDRDLHCLSMPHKKDAKLIWVKLTVMQK